MCIAGTDGEETNKTIMEKIDFGFDPRANGARCCLTFARVFDFE